MAPSGQYDDIVHLKRRTVICSTETRKGRIPKNLLEEIEWAEQEVKTFVEDVIKTMHDQRALRWEDPDFGPSKSDATGAHALYRNGRSAVPGYPRPEELRWSRPGYTSTIKGIETRPESSDQFCTNAILFKDKGAINSTLIQGKLGNGWFLSAVAVAASKPGVIKSCFWRLDDFKNYGIFVVRFFKNNSWQYVIIDDRIPVFDSERATPCFARCQDKNEIWLPLLEKAYAKLHFSYDSLTGGQVDVAMRELTGQCAERILLSPGMRNLKGESQSSEVDMVWRYIRESIDFGSVLGCIAQPEDALSLNLQAQQGTVVSSRGNAPRQSVSGLMKLDLGDQIPADSTLLPSSLKGLERRHAYSVIGAKIVAGKRLLLLHNPWSFGNWLGPWSSISPEYQNHQNELQALFSKGELEDPANFVISLLEFLDMFSSLITTVQPKPPNTQLSSIWKGGYLASDRWTEQNAGGGVDKETWFLNPKFKFQILEPQTRLFVQLFLNDRRIENSKHTNDTLYTFSICELSTDHMSPVRPFPRDTIPRSSPRIPQPSYTFHPSCSRDFYLPPGEFALVPHTLDRDVIDSFGIFFMYDKPVQFEKGLPLQPLNDDSNNKISAIWAPKPQDEELPGESIVDPSQVMDHKAKAIKAEEIKEKLLTYAKQKDISVSKLVSSFRGSDTLNRIEFKQRMVNLGFSVSDIPDKEFEALCYPDDCISAEKIRAIFEQDLLKQNLVDSKPPTPVDDLMFRPPATTEGVLNISVVEAQDLVLSATGYTADSYPRYHTDSIRRTIKSVYTSPVVQISSRKVILRMWKVLSQPDTPCIPIAYDISLGADVGFNEFLIIHADETDRDQTSFWQEAVETCCSKGTLQYDHLPGKIEKDSVVYVHDRLAYINEVLGHHGLNLVVDPRSKSPPSGITLKEESLEDEEKEFLNSLKNSSKTAVNQSLKELKVIVDDVINNLYKSKDTKKLDQQRNEEFLKLKKLASGDRRQRTRNLNVSDHTESIGFSDGEREAYMNPPVSPPSPPATASTGSTGSSAGAVSIGPLPTGAMESIFNLDIMTRISDIIEFSREKIKPGAWSTLPTDGSEDIDESDKGKITVSPTFNVKGARQVFTRVVEIPGEAKVLQENISRVSDLEGWFKEFDKDGTGKIDHFEFKQALNVLGLQLNDDEFSNLVMHLDKNCDGLIDYSEFVDFAEGEQDIENVAEENIPLVKLLCAIASPSVDSTQKPEYWSVGNDWFKLRDFSTQLRYFTRTCKLKEHRTAFSLDAKFAAPRVYRIAHFFGKSEYLSDFITRAAHVATGNESPLIDSPGKAREVLVSFLSSINGASKQSSDGGDEINLDAVIANLPAVLQDVLGTKQDGSSEGVRGGDFSEAVLLAHAKAIVAEKLADELATSAGTSLTNEERHEREFKLLEEVKDEMEKDPVGSAAPSDPTVYLTLAQQMRMLVDDALVYCKAKRVNRSTLARMIAPDNVTAVEIKLRHILRQRRESSERPGQYLVTVYAHDTDRGKSNEPVESTLLDIEAFSAETGRVLYLNSVEISEEESISLPPKGGTGFSIEPEKYFLEDLVERLILCKDIDNSNGDRLALALRESASKVTFVRETLDSCHNLPFFYEVSDRNIRFFVDQITGSDCKTAVLVALRAEQGNRVAKAFCSMRSILQVVFEQTHGEFREEMAWEEFIAYLAEKRHSLVEVKVLPAGESFATLVARDGGLNPAFKGSFSEAYTPVKMANRSLVLTRVCKIDGQYLILFVHHLANDGNRLGLVAYDPRSNDEFSLKIKRRDLRRAKTIKAGRQSWKGKELGRLPQLQPWGSPKRRFKAAAKGMTFFLEVSKPDDDDSTPRELLYDAETIRVIDSHPIFEEDGVLSIGTSFPYNDEQVWDNVLDHFSIGDRLTPHVEFTVLNTTKKAGVDFKSVIGSVRFPLSTVVDSPGRTIDRWLPIFNGEGEERGKLHFELRFDDSCAPPSETVTAQLALFQIASHGDEFLPPELETELKQEDSLEDTLRVASSAKDLSMLASRLREEVVDTKSKLAESEKARRNLEDTIKSNEETLRQTRSEIEHQRRKLDEAASLAKEKEPRPPKRFENVADYEAFTALQQNHETKLRELDFLRRENDRLKNVTDSRESRLQSDIRNLRSQLDEAEMRLRLEVTEKQELLSKVEKANIDAQVNLARNAQISMYPPNPIGFKEKFSKPKGERDMDRDRREKWLQDRLGKEYTTYKKELDSSVGSIEKQISSRRPDKPEQPLKSLEALLVYNAKPNQSELKITAESFQECLLNFGLSIKPADMELLITHFDTAGDNNVSIADFIDSLQDSLLKNGHPKGVATQGVRGVQMQRRNRNY